MSTVLRQVLAVMLGLLSMCAFGMIWVLNDLSTYEESYQSSQQILSGFRLMGEFTEEFRRTNGRAPNDKELLQGIDSKQFEFRVFNELDASQTSPVWISASSEPCLANEDSTAIVSPHSTYRICYWSGEWIEEYAPETGEHSLPSRLEDYRPTLWQSSAALLIAFFLMFCAHRAWPSRDSTRIPMT